MITLMWLKGLLSRRSGRLLGAGAGIALTVGLLAAIGSFVATSAATMTRHAIADVPVDWQIQLVPGASVNPVMDALGKSTGYTASQTVGYADVAGLVEQTNGTVQTTGAGKALGLDPSYRQDFPAQIRPLVGSTNGVLLAQQTAANLHAKVGDTITIERVDLAPVSVRVDGVVDLPNADSLFQAIGVPPGAAPQAPPDNVVILPISKWHQIFDPQATARPDSVRIQLHIRLAHDFPADPGAAYIAVQQRAHNLEARIAGSGIVGDNLAARLDGARSDALYARVLFLFLGLPGVLLAALLTFTVAAAGQDRRRREQALLRVRGAPTSQILRLAALEALLVGLGGVVGGLVLALVVGRFGSASGATLASAWWWMAGAALTGALLAVGAVVYPAWRQVRQPPGAAARTVVGRARPTWWQRVYLDILLLMAAAVAFFQVASSGYQVVLAPEGVAQSSVSYQSFIAPVCLWVGVALLAVRLWEYGLQHGRGLLTRILRPLGHELAGVVAASLGRQRVLLTRGVVLVALAFSFAISTAVFNTTYNAQSQVDAQLTNGADVTVTGTTSTPASSRLAALDALPGVVAAQPMQHRFAYVGNDLQDLYGIDPSRIGQATAISNAYFANRNAAATLATLAQHPDGVLVSAETMRDFQLKPGDRLNLRLQRASDRQYHVVPFQFVGIVREFPTAPKDSFLIANASYVAQQTGASGAEIVLLRTNGDPGPVANAARQVVSRLPGVKVTDLRTTQAAISSSLTAVDLHGLTVLELSFAVIFLAGATGLVLALGLAERRRTFAILAALGAKGSQLGAFLWSEGLLVLLGGSLIGAATGMAVAQMLVTVLTGVFDPPPEVLAVPWPYLGILVVAAIAATFLAIVGALRASRRPMVDALRDL